MPPTPLHTGDVAVENAKCWRPQCIGRWGKNLWHDRILVVIDGFCTYIFWIFFGLETWLHEKKDHNNDGKKVLQKRLLTQVLKSAKKGAEKAPNNTGAEKAPINTGAEKRQVLKKRQITEVLKSAKKGAEKAPINTRAGKAPNNTGAGKAPSNTGAEKRQKGAEKAPKKVLEKRQITQVLKSAVKRCVKPGGSGEDHEIKKGRM